MNMLIIADDLSGAADCAIGFASAGHRTVVTLDANNDPDADVIAADTDTRRLPPAEAGRRTVAAWRALRAPGRRLYKKIDSTLRGNWAFEVAALQPLAGLAIVAPAFPATGRTVRGARVFVHGKPLETTDTWSLENAGRPADVQAMLTEAGLSTARLDVTALREGRDRLAAQIATAAERGAQALVVDAETTEDLRAIAQVTARADGALFWVGSGGLARELASLPELFEAKPRLERPAYAMSASRHAPVLILVGSLSATSERQCAVLRERTHVQELTIPPAVLRRCESHAEWPAWQARIAATLGAHRDLLLRIGRDDAFDAAEGVALSSALAALVKPHFAALVGLVATGGETARAMLSAAGVSSLELLAEIEAGVAVGRPLGVGLEQHLRIVTKAGAFGTDQALLAAWRHFHEGAEAGAVSHDSI
jgi:uncharacterized protein YgbK (DUF1537 family)